MLSWHHLSVSINAQLNESSRLTYKVHVAWESNDTERLMSHKISRNWLKRSLLSRSPLFSFTSSCSTSNSRVGVFSHSIVSDCIWLEIPRLQRIPRECLEKKSLDRILLYRFSTDSRQIEETTTFMREHLTVKTPFYSVCTVCTSCVTQTLVSLSQYSSSSSSQMKKHSCRLFFSIMADNFVRDAYTCFPSCFS